MEQIEYIAFAFDLLVWSTKRKQWTFLSNRQCSVVNPEFSSLLGFLPVMSLLGRLIELGVDFSVLSASVAAVRRTTGFRFASANLFYSFLCLFGHFLQQQKILTGLWNVVVVVVPSCRVPTTKITSPVARKYTEKYLEFGEGLAQKSLESACTFTRQYRTQLLGDALKSTVLEVQSPCPHPPHLSLLSTSHLSHQSTYLQHLIPGFKFSRLHLHFL
jgi:hypothetical protein